MKFIFIIKKLLAKEYYKIFVDLIGLVSSFICAIGFYDVKIPPVQMLTFITLSAFVMLAVFYYFGIYRLLNRYLGNTGFYLIAKGVFVTISFLLLILVICNMFNFIPLTLFAGIILLNFCIGSRILMGAYYLKTKYVNENSNGNNKNILIYGAGEAGIQISHNFPRDRGIILKGYLDDDLQLHDLNINGIKIYDPKKLPDLISSLQIDEIYVALPSVDANRYHEIISFLNTFPVHIKTLPKLNDIPKGRVRFDDAKEVNVEDLLLRPAVTPDPFLLSKNITRKIVLVTGAGGSIGSEICKQVVALNPKKIILVDHSEYNLYSIYRSLNNQLSQNKCNHFDLIPLLTSVLDKDAVNKIMSVWKPDTVFHAAAYKHVMMVESNLAVGIRNNIWGTLFTAQAAYLNQVKNFILISTDKAVRPTSAMGASKRISELILQAFAMPEYQSFISHQTCFSMVRFGNVLGSSGSVVPLFQEQIKAGGPITLRHREITRFFMTINEAAQLVIQASALSHGGDVFLLDMGQPIKIYDLAKKMVELSGFTIKDNSNPNGDIEILVTGLGAGEKLYEEVLIKNEPLKTVHPKIMKGLEVGIEWSRLERSLTILDNALNQYDPNQIYDSLLALVPNYLPTGEFTDSFYLADL
jgi:FlaA1/EpsC-like NDP-sugar epimerase